MRIRSAGKSTDSLLVVASTGGALGAFVSAMAYGLPGHAVVGLFGMAYTTGFGVTVGFHRLFTHRSFATFRPVEWTLLVLGCMAGQSSPFAWVATHRIHHRFSDNDGDPHSPHVLSGRRIGLLRGFWHAHIGWIRSRATEYQEKLVNDLAKRPDLVWIDRYWFTWYLIGLVIPAVAGFAVGGTAYDALIGFLWGGLLRHFLTLQATFCVNSVTHLFGSRPFPTADQSRNNFVVGVLAFGEGWHNNHHAFPWSARQGLRWWQLDYSWWVIWGLEKCGLVWHVRRVPVASSSLARRMSPGRPRPEAVPL
jgi:stearoyl-CoA desaturase (delta-9 desaturase)